MAATPTDVQTGRGGEKSNPQSPVLFGPATDNKAVVAVDQSLGIEEFEREIENYIENLGSLGGPGGSRPPKSKTMGAGALAGDIYPVDNKDKRKPVSDPKITTRRVPVLPTYDYDRDYVEPTPSAMLRGGEAAGGARRKTPGMRRETTNISPPTLLWGRGQDHISQFATPSAWSLGEGATGMDRTMPGLEAAFRPVREEDEVRFRTPQAAHEESLREERRYRTFMSANVQAPRDAQPGRTGEGERPRLVNLSPPGTPERDYWVADTQESKPKRVCRTPREEIWPNPQEVERPAGGPAHSTELRQPVATRWDHSALAAATETEAAWEPSLLPPARLLRQEEASGEALMARMGRGTWPANGQPESYDGGKTFVVTAGAIRALSDSMADVRDALRLSLEYFSTMRAEAPQTRPAPLESYSIPHLRPVPSEPYSMPQMRPVPSEPYSVPHMRPIPPEPYGMPQVRPVPPEPYGMPQVRPVPPEPYGLSHARPAPTEQRREEPWGTLPMDAAPTMEVALPTPTPAAAPRAEITERVQNRKRFDYKKVPAFDSNKMEWRDFLGIFEMAARWNEWTDTQKAQQLAMSMTGSAQKYVLRLPAATLESYPDLVAAVTRRYDPEEREAANLADFQNRKRHDKESVEDYGQALQSLAGKAFPETPEQALERMVIFQFTAGMEEEDLRRHIHFGRAKTMDKAISLAVEWESFSNKKKDNDKDKADTPVKPKVASVEANPIADQMEVLLAKLDRIGEGWRGRPRADKSRVTCYGCGALGHFRRECPHEQNPQGRHPRASAQGPPSGQAAPTAQGHYASGPVAAPVPNGQYQGSAAPQHVNHQPAPYASGSHGTNGPAMPGPYVPNPSTPAYEPATRPSAPAGGPNVGPGAPRGN